jgi:hypothetical protein
VNSLLNNMPSPSTDTSQQGALSISPAVKNKIYQTSKLLEIPAVLPSVGNNIQYVNPVTSIVPSGVNILNYVNPAQGVVDTYGKMSYANVAKAPPVVKMDTNSSANNTNTTQGDNCEDGADNEIDDLKKKKRKRKRNRKRKKKNGNPEDGDNAELEEQTPASSKPDVTDSEQRLSNTRASFDTLMTETAPLHFEDENEFPGLVSAAGGPDHVRALTYSDVLQTTGWPYVSNVRSSYGDREIM